MKRFLSVSIFGLMICLLAFAFIFQVKASMAAAKKTSAKQENKLSLSDMQVKITSKGRTATFQLYNTVAAKDFYTQLPLRLKLNNFRDAQWMFYPPKKIRITEKEAYHYGKKGELSYYEPWGDVFMLYKDFHAGDEMHRLGINLSGIEEIKGMSGNAIIEKLATNLKISVQANHKTTVFKLNNSQAAKDLYAQLPLSVRVENYSNNEKIFYPPKKLNTTNTPQANARPGTLAYYAPWGDVVMFYGDFGSAAGLYELGQAISGSEYIEEISGTVRIEQFMAR